MLVSVSRLLVFAGLYLISHGIAANEQSSWVRGVVRAAKFVSGKDAHETFQMQVVRSDNGSLTGMAVLTREISEKQPLYSSIEVQGIQVEGRFWPFVRAEVANDLDGKWQEIVIKQPAGEIGKRQIEPRTLGVEVFVDLNSFRPFIGQKRYGRVVLPNGEAATFFIENLMPPSQENAEWERGGANAGELHPTQYEGTFLVPLAEQQRLSRLTLSSVEGKNTHVIGYFVYAGEKPATDQEKKRQYLEPLTLSATFQVAHEYHDGWQSVTSAPPEAKAVRLSTPPPITLHNCAISLDSFRDFIGTYRYGRVVLPTGDFAVIQLMDLLPPENELITKEHPDWR